MTWTFDDTDISTTIAQVRVAIGDTNSNDKLLTDEIIQHYLDLYSDDVLTTAIDCVQFGILPKLARDVDRSNVGMSATRSQKFTQYKDILAKLQAGGNLAQAFAGGLSISGKDGIKDDSDYEQAAFTHGQDDYK